MISQTQKQPDDNIKEAQPLDYLNTLFWLGVMCLKTKLFVIFLTVISNREIFIIASGD